MEFLSEQDYIKLLKAVKEPYNIRKEDRYIKIEKAVKIFRQVKANKKIDEFLIGRFLEQYVYILYKNREEIMRKISPNEGGDIHQNNYYINLPVEEFEKILSKMSINDQHLLPEQIQEMSQLYERMLNDKIIYNTFSYMILKKYALFIYSNRYQIRMVIDKQLMQMEKDQEGNYILKDNTFIAKVNRDGGKNSPLWICMRVPEEIKNNAESQETRDTVNNDEGEEFIWDLVVKNLFDENQRETALIAEEIARQLGLPVAQYYPTIYTGKKYSKEGIEEKNNTDSQFKNSNNGANFVTERIVITPNFLKPGEELITGDRIARNEMDVSLVPDKIREFFENQGLDRDEIDRLVSDYKVVMAYNCLINHRDGHNGNWGYIKDKQGHYKLSHIFDLEGCLDENLHRIRAVNIGDIYSGMGENIDGDILKYLLQDKLCREKVRNFYKLNLRDVFSNVFISKGVRISVAKQNAVREIIEEEKEIFQKTIRELDNIQR